MKFRYGLAISLFSLLAAPLTALSAAAEWRMVTTPHFRVLSQANEQKTQLWVRNYQQFVSAVSTAIGIKPTVLPPLTIVLFARDKEFTPYKMMRDGKAARVAGQFVRMGGVSAIGMAADAEADDSRRVIYHESTHWLMSADPSRHPTWFTEGIAEMFATFEQNAGKVNWAKPIDSHLLQLHQNGLLPLKDFLAQTDALQDQDRDDYRFYAQSWAFVHFLMLSQPSRMQLLDRVLAESRSSSSEAAVSKVLGTNLAALEKDFNHYVQQAAFSYFTFPAEKTVEASASAAPPPGLVDATLGFMALATGRKELAQQHAQRAVESAATLPEGHEVLALLARQNQDDAAIRRHAEAAVRAGSRSAEMYVMMANSLGRERAGGFQATAAARMPLLRKAIELDPVRRAPYRQLANDLMHYEKPAVEDLRPLELGLRRFPNDDWLRVGAAVAMERLGDSIDALQVIQAALQPGSSLTSDERRSVTSLEMTMLVARMNAALASGRNAELKPLFERILAHPAVTPQLRNFVETTRQRIGQ